MGNEILVNIINQGRGNRHWSIVIVKQRDDFVCGTYF
jgi:hypothetical protein